MARQTPQSMPEEEFVTAEFEESVAHSDRLREQLKSSERLTEYYNQVVAELRASLEEIERREQAS